MTNLNAFQEVSLLARPSSIEKPAWQNLAKRGFDVISIDLSKEADPDVLRPFEVIVSAIDNSGNREQQHLATAAKAAGVKRFVPCGFAVPCPPGVMAIKDAKDEVHNHIFRLKLPYTLIDVGYWNQLSFPRLSSGRVDEYAIRKDNIIYGDGNAPNLMTDLRDIGRFVSRIIKDPRTLNQKVFTYSDEITQHEILAMAERLSGEKIEYQTMSADELKQLIVDATAALEADPNNFMNFVAHTSNQYNWTKYIRADNTRENGIYLGYLDARKLYPDFKPISFEETFKDALDHKLKKVYADRF